LAPTYHSLSPCCRLLGFKRLDALEKAQQTQRIAQQLRDNPPPAPTPSPPKRAPGRPKKQRTVDEVASAAAAGPAAAAGEPAAKQVRSGGYTHWFETAYINDILDAYRRTNHSARRTVVVLQRQAPDNRYAHLSHATIQGWFGPDRKLLPRFQLQLDKGIAAHGGRGPARTLAQAPEVEAEITRVMLQMRDAGAAVNSRIIRCVMQAVVKRMRPDLVGKVPLSQQFISTWAREQLHWRWRARTTAASKLPLDWEEKGMQMAMRIAANMEMHKVSEQAGRNLP